VWHPLHQPAPLPWLLLWFIVVRPHEAVPVWQALQSIAAPLSNGTYLRNQVVLASWTATDGLSGMDTATSTPVANGAAFDTSTFGGHSFSVTATDVAGNQTSANVNVTFALPAGARIGLVSGDGQTAGIGETLAAPLVVVLRDAASQPVAGKTVVFRVVENDGTLSGGSGSPRAIMVDTDAAGHATATYALGTRAGAGNQQVRATAVGFAASSVLPARAGEVIRPYFLARREGKGKSATGAFATIILERLLDMMTVLVLLADLK